MKLCNYCHKPVPQGYDLWWNQKPYHPDCAIQVAVTETNLNTENNRNTANNKNTERREFEMNCRYCEHHIVATCQVMWRGYPFHEDCLAKAIQEANQPSKQELEDQFVDEDDLEQFFPEEDEDFADDELSEVKEPEYANGITTIDPMPPNSVIVAPRAIIHPPVENGNKKAGTLITHCGARRISREELAALPVPEETRTFKPISHSALIEKIIETLWYRRMNIVRDEYAVSQDGMKLFGLLEMDLEYKGVRFAIGIRNSNDKSMRVAMVAGYKVTVCDNMMLQGDFQPLLAKHSKNFALEDGLSIACDRIQRNIGRLHQEINQKQEQTIESQYAKSLLYTAFTDGRFPISLFRAVHREFFVAPSHEEFKSSTMWSLENAFTTSFKKLNPVSQFEMTARLGKFLSAYN